MKQIENFFEALKTNEPLRDMLGQVKHGNWDEVIKIAQDAGHDIQKEGLIKALPEGFWKGFGADPTVGWDISTKPML